MHVKNIPHFFNRSWLLIIVQIVSITFAVLTTLVCVALVGGHYLISSGDIIAFMLNESGNWEIYLMDVNHALLSNLTHHPADDFEPAWSPSTGELAFSSDRDGDGATEIYQMNLDTSAIQRMITTQGNYWQPYWSPDGQNIVFTRDFGNIFVTDTVGQNEIWLGYGFGPAWSPIDSRIALYANYLDDYSDIYLIDADGDNQRNLTSHASDDWSPAWSPDGSQIAFVSARDGISEIYIMEANCTAPCPAQRLTYNTTMELALDWSPDGDLIVFEAEVGGRSQIFVMNVDGSNLHRLSAGNAESSSPIFIH